MTDKATLKRRNLARRLTIETLESRRLMAFDPTGLEQEALEHINRMRMDPAAELDVLFDSHPQPLVAADSSAQGMVAAFRVDGTLLQEQWSRLRPAAPLAWSEDLWNSARSHSQTMIDEDRQFHPPYGVTAQNVFAYSKSPLYAHAAFAIDWGGKTGGIQDPPGHRNNLMNPAFREIGIGILRDDDAQTEVGPLVVTQNFRRGQAAEPYLLGVVFNDADGNGRYDAGEGLGGLPVRMHGTGGEFATQTMSAGGYQLHVPDGTYQVAVALPGVREPMVEDQVIVAGENVKVDFGLVSYEPRTPDTPSPGQNPEDRCDVNGDGWVTALDALIVINHVNANGPHRLADGEGPDENGGMWLDVNGDRSITAADSLVVINRLNTWGGHRALPQSISDPRFLDVNRDRTIDHADAQAVLDYLSGTNKTCTACDVNNDGRVTTLDALVILNYVSPSEPGQADPSAPVHVLGVVYADTNQDGQYDDGEGVADAPVYFRRLLEEYTALTTATGYYHLDVPPGTYEVTAYPPGLLEPVVVQQTFAAGEKVGVDIMIGTSLPVTLDGPSPWQNPADRLDVNGDHIMNSIDALILINCINESGPHELPTDWDPATEREMWLDVNGDGCVTAADAYMVIHQLMTGGPYQLPTADEIHDAALTDLLETSDDLLLAPLMDMPIGV